jgi:protein TilB
MMMAYICLFAMSLVLFDTHELPHHTFRIKLKFNNSKLYLTPRRPGRRTAMVRLTRALIRKKAEHHEGILPDLEEISLHQLEIERIEAVGDICRKIKILYLQNNIISKIENLAHCKDLEYLNLALNNIERIEGLRTCEFLNKLDLTVNFIDLDTFEESVAELRHNRMLREIYLMGNPCADWDGCREFVASVLPSLESLDGKAITRTERIVAQQKLPMLLRVLRTKAQETRNRKAAEKGLPFDDQEYSSASRREMYLEMAEEKKEKEDREKEMQPRQRDKVKEHADSVAAARAREQEQIRERQGVRQCNEGRYQFRLHDDDGDGNVVVEVEVPKFIDTSLIDVDVQPRHVSVVIKNKTLRLRFEEEVRPDAGTAERSKTTGFLKLTIPKVDLSKVLKTRRLMQQHAKEKEEAARLAEEAKEEAKPKTKSSQLLMSAEEAAKANVSWRNSMSTIVKSEDDADKKENMSSGGGAAAGSSAKKIASSLYEADVTVDDSMAPPLE